METEYEKAQTVLDMFCRAAEKATGDYWEVRKMEDGDIAVVQTFKATKKAMDDPKIPDEVKNRMITGALFCMTSGGLADLAENLVMAFSDGPLDFTASPMPLPFLKGCASVEEMTVRLAACS